MLKDSKPAKGLLKKNGAPKKSQKKVEFNLITSRRNLLKLTSNNKEVPVKDEPPINYKLTTKRTNTYKTMHGKRNKNFRHVNLDKRKARFFDLDRYFEDYIL